MPEAPEVERYRLLLSALRNERLVSATSPESFLSAELTLPPQPVVTQVVRHGKKLGLVFGESDVLQFHLGMTGELLLVSPEIALETFRFTPHARAMLAFESRALIFADRRRFGRVRHIQLEDFASGLGVDLLDASINQFRDAALTCATRRRSVKSLMLDQAGPVAGVGNYLADEACFASMVHPARRSDELSVSAWLGLWMHCRATAACSVRSRPASLADYRAPAGSRSFELGKLLCYGRAGWPCVRCGETLVRTTVGSRGTSLCPRCQPMCAAQLEGK